VANIARGVMLGVAGGITTRVVRRATRNALHTERGLPRIPRGARRQTGFRTMLLWAAGAGAALALADVLKEQQQDSKQLR
jgi:hypothetical protein